jgi:hypothetical protein
VRTPDHGALNSEPAMDSFFDAFRYGIRPGVRIDRVSALQVAATIRALLGLTLPAATGTPIVAIGPADAAGRRDRAR